MGYRQIYIKKAKKIFLEYDNIGIIREDETKVILPLEDISNILLEDPNTVITSRLLTKMSEFGVSMTLCNEQFMPSTQVLPLNTYFNQNSILKKQMNATQFLKDKLWQKIIKNKIINQMNVIELTTGNVELMEQLKNYSKEVKSADKENREGISARMFFKDIYGDDFTRFGSSAISSALNYGYSILHASISRQLLCLGLNTNLGIWHDSDQNAYNLSSDLIEIFRPIVDYYIFWHRDEVKIPLDKEIRKNMVDLLNAPIKIDGMTYKVEYAINSLIQSFLKCLDTNSADHLISAYVTEIKFYE